jgi:2-dehydropantoate 2-reductase
LKICVLGAGALGCSIGAALTEGGSDVWLVNRATAHVDAMNSAGLRLRDGDTERTVKVKAATDCSGIGVVDLVIVLVKSFDTREAIQAAATIIGEHTTVLSLQNGLGHEDILAAVIGRRHLLAGKTYVGGVLLGPGHIISGTRGKQTYIGELDGAISPRALAIAGEFNQAGLETTVSRNIIGTIWDKLLVNVATGALSGITGLAYGALYKVPEIETCALAAVAEAMAVAEASGVRLSIREPREAWLKAAEGLPPEFKASMLQSLEKNSVTEIDFVNGAVVCWGERCHVPTPVNRTLVAGIKGIEYQIINGAAAARS